MRVTRDAVEDAEGVGAGREYDIPLARFPLQESMSIRGGEVREALQCFDAPPLVDARNAGGHDAAFGE